MDRRLLFPAVAATVWAQQASPQAVEAEKALRERVQKFYQLQQDKKYREAEAFVADDTKDDYYAGKKPDLKGFSIEGVRLLEGNTRAVVTVKAKIVALMMGGGMQMFEMPTPTTWKLENSEWRWYVSAEAKAASPFGNMKAGEGGTLDKKGEAPGGIDHPDFAALLGQITIDKTSVELSHENPDENATINSALPGSLDLTLDPHVISIKGLTVKIDKPHLEAGERAVINFHWDEITPISDSVRLVATPLNRLLEVKVAAKN